MKDEPLQLKTRLAIAVLVAAVLALWIFTPGVMSGQHIALAAPQGDQAQALAGAFYFYRDSWRWPLFEMVVPGLGTTANIAYTDSIPLLALAGKLWFKLTGEMVSLVAPWLWTCVLGLAIAFTLLLDAIGLRRLSETLAGVALVSVMPVFLFRYWMWHLALCGQFVIVFALTLMVGMQRTGLRMRSAVPWAALLVAALWIHPYFLAMVMPLFLVGTGCSLWRSQGSDRREVAVSAGIVLAAVSAAFFVGGYLQGGHEEIAGPFGVYSMNMLAPFGAMGKSGLLPESGHFARATDGQMEGFNYLGLGVLFGLAVGLPALALRRGAEIWQAVRANWPLVLSLVAMTVFALSNVVYFGSYKVVDVPLPPMVEGVAAIFRSSGRFFWLVGYALVALCILAISRGYRSSCAAGLLCIVVTIQWLDTSVLRTVIVSEKPADPVGSNSAVTQWVASHDALSLHPPVQCADERVMGAATYALQFVAAREGKATNGLSEARRGVDCVMQSRKLQQMQLSRETLVVLGPPYDANFIASRGWQEYCQAVGALFLCSLQIKNRLH